MRTNKPQTPTTVERWLLAFARASAFWYPMAPVTWRATSQKVWR